MRTAICFFVASTRHRIPPRPRWRFVYRHARAALLRVAFGRHRGGLPREAPYLVGVENALRTLRREHASLPPILLLTPDRIEKPAFVDELVHIDCPAYFSVRGAAYEFGITVFMKLALFRLQGFERIVYFDSDLLFVDDVSSLWDPQQWHERALWAAPESEALGATFAPALGTLNTGVMVLNAPMRGEDVYEALLSLARAGKTRDGGDQGVVNAFLEDGRRHLAGALPVRMNTFVSDAALEQGLLDQEPAILHFVGESKPFGPRGARAFERDETIRALYQAIVEDPAPRPLARARRAAACVTGA
jgi:hypothetical protein